MKKISTALAVFAMAVTLLVAVPAPVSAHGVCAKPTANMVISFGQGGPFATVSAGGFCNTVHVSTTIEIFMHRNGRQGPIVLHAINTVPDSRSAEITRLYPCSQGPSGAKYITQAFLYQRQDLHNTTSAWSNAVKCPEIV
jgi:hypothetical protein